MLRIWRLGLVLYNGGVFIQTAATDTRYFLAVCITVIVSICIHELAHGIVAVWHGDRTPIETGHLTLDPAAHISVYSVICLLLAGIAWGSMPVDPKRMRGTYAAAAVFAAGPLANVTLAAIGLVSLGLWQRYVPSEVSPRMETLRFLLLVFGVTNVHLAIFNMIPVPPLDGSGVLANLSRPYSGLMARAQASGASFLVFLIVFVVVGNLTGPLAIDVSERAIVAVRGW